MTGCKQIHQEFDRFANGEVQTGKLPHWTRVNGKVAWWVFQGPYTRLSDAWARFGKDVHEMGPEKFSGPPGDIYVCDPNDHKATEEKLLTILWAPLKE